jgi:hypothetical protein
MGAYLCGNCGSNRMGIEEDNKHQKVKSKRALLMNRSDISKIIREQVVNELKTNQYSSTAVDTYKINKCNDENQFLQGEIKNLELKLQAMTSEYVNFKSNTQDNNNSSYTNLTTQKLHHLYQDHIKKFVEAILADPDTNISWLPDVVERRLYINIATIALKSFEALLETSTVNFLSHKLQFVVDPIKYDNDDGKEKKNHADE